MNFSNLSSLNHSDATAPCQPILKVACNRAIFMFFFSMILNNKRVIEDVYSNKIVSQRALPKNILKIGLSIGITGSGSGSGSSRVGIQ